MNKKQQEKKQDPLVAIGSEFEISGRKLIVKEITREGIKCDMMDGRGGTREVELDLDKVAFAVTT
jgi:hypothetical protein